MAQENINVVSGVVDDFTPKTLKAGDIELLNAVESLVNRETEDKITRLNAVAKRNSFAKKLTIAFADAKNSEKQ